MDFESLRAFCLSLPGTTEEIQWGADLLFKVGGKTFVFTGMDAPWPLTIKCSDEDFGYLIEREDIPPAAYLGRYKWIRLKSITTLPPKDLQEYIRKSYMAIFTKLPKKVRLSIGEFR